MTARQITYWTWTARILTLLGVIAGVLAAADKLPPWLHDWSTLAVALTAAAIGWIRGFLPAVKGRLLPTAVLLGCAVGMILSAGCPSPAWRTLDGVQRARDLTAQQLAASARAKHQSCLQAHGSKTAGYARCIAPHRKALQHWQTVARPAINSSIQITATALQIAERAKVSEKVDWLKLLTPAICGLVRVARAWGHYYPDQVKSVLAALRAAEGVTCK